MQQKEMREREGKKEKERERERERKKKEREFIYNMTILKKSDRPVTVNVKNC